MWRQKRYQVGKRRKLGGQCGGRCESSASRRRSKIVSSAIWRFRCRVACCSVSSMSFEQVQQRIGVGLLGVGFQRRELVEVEELIPISSDLNQDQITDPSSQPGEHFFSTVRLGNAFR